ncbi:M15 family metallopeptidase [Paenisporosarcina antarctica]|uniref:M15 family peptidase n=1 Tax=Paenisporosarcina antarctica TaxID=417367 RepID=A0A4P7A2A8_9BACL|nr:M15 family metallopeptidase [Paenisporosarcina antarctica]QBP42788.1 M15 family peptidase [Paenisporosarcina antarctica]
MKRFWVGLNIAFWLVIGGLIFVWVHNELESKEERQERPLPEGLHPIVEEKSNQLLERVEKIGIPIIISDSFRSIESQDVLYDKGRSIEGSIVTYARGGQSYHNYGLAIDFVLLNSDGTISYDLQRDLNGNDEPDWFEVVRIAKDLGFLSGAEWPGFKDYPHLEYTFGLSIRDLQNGWRPEDKMDEK